MCLWRNKNICLDNLLIYSYELTLCMLGNFSCLFVICGFVFYKINFFKKRNFRNTIRVSNSLDPDQASRFFRPDLGPNCLQRLSADDKSHH